MVSFTTTNTVRASALDTCLSRVVVAAANCLGRVASAPVVRAPTMANGSASLAFPTEAGKSYVVQYKNALSDPTWIDLETVVGTGGSLPVTDTTAGHQPARFYRIIDTPE